MCSDSVGRGGGGGSEEGVTFERWDRTNNVTDIQLFAHTKNNKTIMLVLGT